MEPSASNRGQDLVETISELKHIIGYGLKEITHNRDNSFGAPFLFPIKPFCFIMVLFLTCSPL